MNVKSIKINAFRGIPQMEMDLQGKNLLLQGENGTGKSSFIDAIEFFFTGKIEHLPGKQSVSLKKYACHVNFEPEDLKIEMKINPDGIIIERTLNSFSTYPSPLENEFKIAENGRFILRRSQILNFIESAPAERYKFLGNILGIDKLEKTEKEFLKAYKQLQNQVEAFKETSKE
jgi:recombinational DNA repair ATPase RecF